MKSQLFFSFAMVFPMFFFHTFEFYSIHHLPSGKRLQNYGKIHHVQWVNPLFLWPFSIAMLTQPEGISINIPVLSHDYPMIIPIKAY